MLTQYQDLKLQELNSKQLEKMALLDLNVAILNLEAETLPDVINKISDSKLKALVDLNCWNKDVFNLEEYGKWLSVICFYEGADSFLKFKRLDHETLILFLSSILHIDWYDKDEIYVDNPVISDDFAFTIYPKNNDFEGQNFAIAVNLIKQAYMGDFFNGRKLCLDCMGITKAQQEEACFINKNNRLSEEGIPNYLEAMDLYFYEDPTKLIKKIKKYIGLEKFKKGKSTSDYIISQYTMVSKDYFDKYFSIGPELIDTLKIEISNLLTASIIVNNALGQDLKFINEITKRSINFLTIGLELLKESIELGAESIFTYVPINEIFRLGFSLLVDIKRHASNLNAVVNEFEDKILISDEEEEFLKYLLMPIPEYFVTYTEILDFDSLAKIKEARVKLSELAKKFVKI